MSALRASFLEVLHQYGVSTQQAQLLWREIVISYGTDDRHYHTLRHLEDVLAALADVWSELEDRDAVLLAIVYHDLVYHVTRNDNEQRSAELMAARMDEARLPTPLVERTAHHIRATKEHAPNEDPDTNFFTDADLSILGASPERYAAYVHEVRREFEVYPDLLYRPGRRKVMKRFLEMPLIFKTAYFRARFEEQARINLNEEMIS